MRRIWSIVATAVLGMFLAVVVAMPSAALPPMNDGWYPEVLFYTPGTYGPGPGSYTGWSQSPLVDIAGDGGYVGRTALHLSEPAWTDDGMELHVETTGVYPPEGSESQTYRIQVHAICDPGNGVNLFEVFTGNTTGTIGYQVGAPLKVFGPHDACGSQGSMAGVAVTFEFREDGVFTEREGMRRVWYPEARHIEGPSITWCRSVFGINFGPNDVAMIAGQEVTALDVGCLEDYLTDGNESLDAISWATDFDVVCANAPEAEWLSFSWLGPWIGHYADCLFVPRGGINTALIAEQAQDGWMGDVRTAVEGIGPAVDAWSGGCGTAVQSLPMGMGSISTCDLGWPSNMRSLAGVAVVGFSTITCVFIIVRLFAKQVSQP